MAKTTSKKARHPAVYCHVCGRICSADKSKRDELCGVCHARGHSRSREARRRPRRGKFKRSRYIPAPGDQVLINEYKAGRRKQAEVGVIDTANKKAHCWGRMHAYNQGEDLGWRKFKDLVKA